VINFSILFSDHIYFVSTNLNFPIQAAERKKLKANNPKSNEPIVLGTKGRIGLLVNEYNHALQAEASKKYLLTRE